MPLNIDYTIGLGSIVEVVGMIGGGLIVIGTLKGTVTAVKEELQSMQMEMKEFGKALIQLARQDIRLKNLEEDIRDLRRGKGFIQEAIDREYPESLK